MSRTFWKPLVWTLAAAAVPSLARADLLTDWNIVTTGNFRSHSSTEVEGAVRIGGNMDVNQYQVGVHLTDVFGPAAKSQTSLVVGGNVTGIVTVHAGNAQIGGTGAQVSATNYTGPGVQTGVASVQGIGAQDAAQLQGYSQAFASMATLSANTVILPTTQPAGVVFTVAAVDANNNAVFNINGADLFGSKTQQIGLSLSGLTESQVKTVIINVTGTAISFSNWSGNFSGFFTQSWARSHVIWNFQDATSLDLTNREFNGAILAYQASLQTGSAPVQGSVFVREYFGPNGVGQTGEVHMPLYQGYVPGLTPTATPEPSSFAMAGLAMAASAGVAWRRKRARA